MKKVNRIFVTAIILFIAYNLFLFYFPLRKTVFFTNEENIEEYTYTDESFDNVIVGSSLSGAFQDKILMDEKYFPIYLPYTGACTGLDVVKRCGKVPKKLFVEINHIDRGIDSSLIRSVFDPPFHMLRFYLPSLRSKNKLLNNFVDRVKTIKSNKINDNRPADVLYNQLLKSAQEKWNDLGDTALLDARIDMVRSVLMDLSSKGCKVYFYEMPMDSSITNSPLIVYQRNYFKELARAEKYVFIPLDRSRTYQTGDGEHLLKKEVDIYTTYLRSGFTRN